MPLPAVSRYARSRHHGSLIDPHLDRLTRCWNLSDRTRIARLRRQSRSAHHVALWQQIQYVVTTTSHPSSARTNAVAPPTPPYSAAISCPTL
jgi:hypothetical protein